MNIQKFFAILLAYTAAINMVSSADDTALAALKSVSLKVIPDSSVSLNFKIRNSVELKLRQAGMKVTDDGPIELRLLIVSINLDPAQQQIQGRYGMVAYKLYEPVALARESKIPFVVACTWEGSAMMMQGPNEGYEDRIHQTANNLADEFLNRWLKAKEAAANKSPDPIRK